MSNLGLRTIFVESRPTARQLRKAKLVVTEGPDLGAECYVNTQKTYVGRSAVNDLVLKDPRVSSTHAEIEVSEDVCVLRDLGSTNGTLYAGARVREIYLAPEMTFVVGNSTIRFEALHDVVEIPLSRGDHFGSVCGRSIRMREIFAVMEKVAPSDLTVLITGETGTGKERLARSIHDASRRAAGPYVVLDCSSIPKDLAESTVFGHEKGSFTGAVSTHHGPFEQANGGTIFLDEVGELELALQPKLLRVLEQKEVKRVGGNQTIYTDVRVIAATNRDLRAMVADGTFREDLYFRLSVIQCRMPPLRERIEDIELVAEEIVRALAPKRRDLGAVRLTRGAIETLAAHPWPGNVRELKNVLERAVSLADRGTIEGDDLLLGGSPKRRAETPSSTARRETDIESLDADGDLVRASFEIDTSLAFKDTKQRVVDQFEDVYLRQIMSKHGGNLSKASREVGLTRYHLRELLKKHGLLDMFRSAGDDES